MYGMNTILTNLFRSIIEYYPFPDFRVIPEKCR